MTGQDVKIPNSTF